jgi:hypothetical protein
MILLVFESSEMTLMKDISTVMLCELWNSTLLNVGTVPRI